MDAQSLSEKYASYDYRKRLEAIFNDFERVLVTSSFGATSSVLLHLIHKVRPDYPVYFIDTRYHFPETYAYKDELVSKWGLNVISAKPKINEHLYTSMNYTWAHQPDACCYMNKVMPLEPIKAQHDVWISGMVGGTTDLRRKLQIFRQERDLLRFYPLIDMTPKDAELYMFINELPRHPLEARGYGSIGCKHCTRKGEGRSGRWAGFQKSECGLHIIKN
ncbi:MAG: phosphoadenylyl-sulfate reductase [Bacteroidia bacterium]